MIDFVEVCIQRYMLPTLRDSKVCTRGMQKLKVDKQKKDKVKGCPKCKERRSFWILADATVGQKSLKLNFFFWSR